MLIDPRRVVVAAALVGVFALASCGGSGDSSGSTDTTNPAEAHNSAILGEAESDAESVTAIEEELEYQLAPYEYSGVEGTFVTTDGDYCTLGEIYAGEELKPYKNDKNTLLSPNGSVGVSVGTFQGTQDAPCLKAVGEALGWVGGEKKPVTKGAPLSESKLIEEADAICKEGNDEVDTIFGPVETAEEEARALSEARPGYVDRLEAFEALKPPASTSVLFAEYVELLEGQIELGGDAQAAAAFVDAKESVGETAGVKAAVKDFEQAERETTKNFNKRHAIAEKIGLKSCAAP